jgi:hypothetical protein
MGPGRVSGFPWEPSGAWGTISGTSDFIPGVLELNSDVPDRGQDSSGKGRESSDKGRPAPTGIDGAMTGWSWPSGYHHELEVSPWSFREGSQLRSNRDLGRGQERFDQDTPAAHGHRGEALVPVAGRHLGMGVEPNCYAGTIQPKNGSGRGDPSNPRWSQRLDPCCRPRALTRRQGCRTSERPRQRRYAAGRDPARAETALPRFRRVRAPGPRR